jgi:hypothetical protein
MTRMWTLQEGLLATKLRSKFRERAFDGEDMLSNIMPIFHSSVWLETHEFFTLLRLLQCFTLGVKLRHLWNLFQWWSTSHPSDETICLYILSGKQLSKIHAQVEVERMNAFLRQVDGSQAILYSCQGLGCLTMAENGLRPHSWPAISGPHTNTSRRSLFQVQVTTR